jgi:hypothetical protein
VSDPASSSRTGLRADLWAVLPAWLASRLIVALSFRLADAEIEHLGYQLVPAARRQGLLFWDGAFYHDIARAGYGSLEPEALRFFPLYPTLGRLVAPVVGGREDVALVLVANVAAVVAAVLLRRLVIFERDDPALADRAAWLLLLVPPAFVLSFAYSEALFLVFAIGAVLALRRGQWWAVAGLSALAAITRPVGLILLVPMVVEWWQRGRPLRPAVVAAFAGPAVGTGLFLAYTGLRFDTWLEPFRAQSSFRGELVDPVSRLARGVGHLFGDEAVGDGLHLPFALAAIVLLVVCARRWPAPYTALAGALVLVALAADNLNSLERYLLVAFPLVMALADLTGGQRAERLALALCGGGTLALSTLALLGVYVP